MVAVLEVGATRELHAQAVEPHAPVEFFLRFASPYSLQNTPQLIRDTQAGDQDARRQLLTPEGLLHGMPIEKLIAERDKESGFQKGPLRILSPQDLFKLFHDGNIPVISTAGFNPRTEEVVPRWMFGLQTRDGFFDPNAEKLGSLEFDPRIADLFEVSDPHRVGDIWLRDFALKIPENPLAG